jgi:hypothetical protein
MSTITLWDILNDNVPDLRIKRGIEIPMIQRDYAQGRGTEKVTEIRKVFLNSVLNGIKGVMSNNKPPMELDFIYGYIEGETFIPLDGQQRLTTLYLLYWYLAFKDGQLGQYIDKFTRFNYQTRQSSEDFLKQINHGLVTDDHQRIFSKGKSFREVISDKSWYYYNWDYDLTIQSALTMLDAIHQVFREESITFNDMISPGTPKIKFNFLDIEDFGLSDNLYIKMNSRGKPLTNFENLKAELGRFIELSDFNNKHNFQLEHSEGVKNVDVETYFITKIDTSWSDYFWKLRNRETNEFDAKLLCLLAFTALNEAARKHLGTFDKALGELDGTNELSYYKFVHLELLNEDSIIFYIKVLDLLVNTKDVIKEYLADKFILDKPEIVSYGFEPNFKPRYEQRVLWYAIFNFLIVNNGNPKEEELEKWDRLMRNLIYNTQYNNSRDFQESIKTIRKLCVSYDGNIYSQFLHEKLTGFDGQQVREEKLKIELIQRHGEWRDLISEAEAHGYLKGQIMCLFAFSGVYQEYLSNGTGWSEFTDTEYYNSVLSYWKKFKCLFSDKGLKHFKGELFRRALLTKCDYTLYSTNWSFVIDNHRDISWKRLLRETGNPSENFKPKCVGLKELFDDIHVDDAEGSLKVLINNHLCSDWRKDFIENAILINRCYEKYFKFLDDGKIYVLRKSKYNRYADPEVKSLLLHQALIKKGLLEKDIELGFIENLNQYGIVRIKNLRPRIVYNHDGRGCFLVRQKGKDDKDFKSLSQVVKYISESLLN